MGLLAVTVKPSGHRDRLLAAEGIYRAKEQKFFAREGHLQELDFALGKGVQGRQDMLLAAKLPSGPGVMSASLRMLTLPASFAAETGIADVAGTGRQCADPSHGPAPADRSGAARLLRVRDDLHAIGVPAGLRLRTSGADRPDLQFRRAGAGQTLNRPKSAEPGLLLALARLLQLLVQLVVQLSELLRGLLGELRDALGEFGELTEAVVPGIRGVVTGGSRPPWPICFESACFISLEADFI